MIPTARSALRAAIILSSISTSKAAVIEQRFDVLVAGNTAILPGAWTFQGCYTDNGPTRTLSGGGYNDGAAMTQESCVSYCSSNNFAYAGIEYSAECYCGNAIATGAISSNPAQCSMTCPGDATEGCGGPSRLSLFWSGKTIAAPANKISIGKYEYYGCQTEATDARALASTSTASSSMTNEACATFCSGYSYFGTEYGQECYCGNSFGAGSVPALNSECSMGCAADSSEFCGAGNRLTVYFKNGTASAASSAASIASSPVDLSAAASTASAAPTPTGFPAGWTSQGCWVDGANGRILTHQQADSQTNTLQTCAQTCYGLGYSIAGAEYGVQCFCDNFVYAGGALAANQGDCNTQCPGATSENCGAGSRMTIYSNSTPQVFQAPGPQQAGLPTGWAYAGCLQDNIPAAENAQISISVFPYKLWDSATNTPEACIKQCQEFGFNAAGLEYGSQCYCGDGANRFVASLPQTSTDPTDPFVYTYGTPPTTRPDTECDSGCTGAPQYLCGSGNRLTWYTYNATIPLYTWNTPTGSAAGEYSLLIGGVVVPLMTNQAITGKVTFVEKAGTGEPNGTGAYELDLTQIDNFSAAWRTMTEPKTDTFCSAGFTLPDKAGRQITVGGWTGDSNFGVRLYWPDGSPGVKGVNQWVEDPTNLRLQVARWYPTALIMANGSILIVGGEIGQNDAEQPTLELLPATGVPDTSTVSGYSNTTKYLDFLDRTAPFNLYPWITVVPSGILIVYYNEVRIIDEVNFNTVKTLPNMPGAVNDPTGGRTYQLQGATVSLPQYAPFTDPLGILVCGGSTTGAGYAIDNCVSTQPEAANPTWTIERMPSRRVMPSMAGLPDGTYLILGGGQHGVAGFGLAGSPNLNAVLYDPTKPVNSRMSIMANTTVPRLYHSEAITLLDGRVMVSGSDPTGDYTDPAGSFPEEYRVEVFSPPYLLSGAARPTFTISNNDWSYGASITFTSSTGGIKVSLLGSVSSTHGNSMGQRTLFPAVTCAGTSCTVTAPPNAHACPPGWYMMFVLDGPTPSVGQFVRIGGDPGNLGNWPNLPGFDLPGTGPV
ncbi:WSC domain-containing protein [Lachnellula hyalina]|uniref:WSC domain-containing protein n=1 Tax=Lachnellula hyalina TaxID=1316788 RepID=A0A8H8U1V2_9HELO|nr:WSC domain-containing protein [Lachnellula hyalina]TVY28312.1 WSC domain-containing protein [Lachnellula hyalina]